MCGACLGVELEAIDDSWKFEKKEFLGLGARSCINSEISRAFAKKMVEKGKKTMKNGINIHKREHFSVSLQKSSWQMSC